MAPAEQGRNRHITAIREALDRVQTKVVVAGVWPPIKIAGAVALKDHALAALAALEAELQAARGDLEFAGQSYVALQKKTAAALQAAQEALRERDEHAERLEALVTHYAALEGNPEQAAERLRMLRDHLDPEAKHTAAPVMNCQWCRDLNRQRFEQEQRA